MKRCSLLFLALCVIAIAAVPTATARDAGCNTVRTDSGQPLVFFKQNMSCSIAKKYAHRLMRDGSYDPRNFKCKRRTPTSGGCTHEVRHERFFIFYPEH